MCAFETFSRLKEIIRIDVVWGEVSRRVCLLGDLDRLRKYIESQAQHHRGKIILRASQDRK